ncbi:MAG: PD-(D/E)XK nuclease domain-containing protein [Bacteroidales bacterium]|nr:PD-(D/E)XK nuclease domain-containing protein [Bacteroidales bacterium]
MISTYHQHFQTIIYLIFSLLWYYTQAEVKSAIGRADAVCWTKDRVLEGCLGIKKATGLFDQ